MADVELTKLNKWYGDFHAVRDLDLQVRDGEFMVLLGPSGSGKTTALRMVAGLEEVSAGDISIGGRRVNDLPPRARDLAMVFQNYALFAHMSVAENLGFGLRMRGTPRAEIETKVADVAQVLGLTNWLHARPRQLSGGMQQRVALGRAIVRKAQLYLMDEPLSNLDALLRVQMRTEIIKLVRALQATVVYVTHDQVEAMTMATRMAVMKDGRAQQIGTPLEVYNRPANRFVASFIGIPQMNFFETAEVVGVNGGVVVQTSQFRLPLSRSVARELDGRGPASARRPTVLGLRPEDIRLVEDGSSPADLTAMVDVVEPLGPQSLVYATSGDLTLTFYADSGLPLRVGQTVNVAVNSDKVHLFDPVSGATLLGAHA